MELGRSVTTVRVKVAADEQSVTFTLHTDQTTLGDALFEHELIAGEKSVDGLYLMVVNGIIAGYDIDQSCWALKYCPNESYSSCDEKPGIPHGCSHADPGFCLLSDFPALQSPSLPCDQESPEVSLTLS